MQKNVRQSLWGGLSLPPARTHLDCCAGWANFSIFKLFYLPKMTGREQTVLRVALQQLEKTISYHFPQKQIIKCSFLPERKNRHILCVLSHKVQENCKWHIAFFFCLLYSNDCTQKTFCGPHAHLQRNMHKDEGSTASSTTGSQSAA